MTSTNRHHRAPAGLAPGPGYSHVATGTGRMVYVAGQVALDEQGALVGDGDVEVQAEQVFINLGHALRSAGATFQDVVKLNYYLTDVTKLVAVRAVRDRHLDPENPPASTLVEVKGLFRPEFLIEVEAVAIVNDSA
ncbi:MAG TPA: RidA family protein [Candidatus Dormibacteraeota bacterium]|jgi:enamine deaminase RidA (YjgF/YER057c/UK114 family)